MLKKLFLVGILFAVLLLLSSALERGWSQENPEMKTTATTSLSETSQEGENNEEKSIIDYEKIMGSLQNWKWPLFGCLFVGVLITMISLARLLWEKFQNSKLRNKSLHRMKINQIKELVKKHPKGSLSGFLDSLIQAHATSRSLQALGTEIQLFRQTMDDRIQGARHWLTYLSSAAGALGLLGTVYGMYTVFSKESGLIEPSLAVYGMGIALVTTGVGIIISLIIDMGSTIIQTLANRSLDDSLQKAEEFRVAAIQDLNASRGGVQ